MKPSAKNLLQFALGAGVALAIFGRAKKTDVLSAGKSYVLTVTAQGDEATEWDDILSELKEQSSVRSARWLANGGDTRTASIVFVPSAQMTLTPGKPLFQLGEVQFLHGAVTGTV